MEKNQIPFLLKNQEFNLEDQDEEEIRISIHTFPSKFIKQLNFLQNCHKIRQRRIKKINQLFEIKGAILQNLKIFQENNKKSNNSFNGASSQNLKDIFYKGSMIKGKLKKRFLHGQTQIIYENGTQFKGVYKNGKMKTGKFDFKNGYQYWGQLQGKIFAGKGTLKCPNGSRITGVWNGDQVVGRAQIQYPTGDVYYGEINKFQKHGEGYLFFKTGNKYIGHFENGQISGDGSYFEINGNIERGLWKNGQLIQKKDESQIKTSQRLSKLTDHHRNSFLDGLNVDLNQILVNSKRNSNKSTPTAFST